MNTKPWLTTAHELGYSSVRDMLHQLYTVEKRNVPIVADMVGYSYGSTLSQIKAQGITLRPGGRRAKGATYASV